MASDDPAIVLEDPAMASDDPAIVLEDPAIAIVSVKAGSSI